MLSIILSHIFRFCFILVLLGGTAGVISEVIQKPIKVPYGENGYLTFGEPGISVEAHRTSGNGIFAPDTAVIYRVIDSAGTTIASGGYNSSFHMEERRRDLDSMVSLYRHMKTKLEIDTTIAIIGQSPDFNNDTAYTLPVGYYSFDKWELERHSIENRISQQPGSANEMLRIQPAGGFQHAGFIIYDIIKFGCLALVFLFLAKLFRNFRNEIFFDRANISLLKRTGWALLIPAIASAILYWSFLFRLRLVKLVVGKIQERISYDLHSGINWSMAVLGVSLLVLAYIFSNAMELKEDNELIA